jgi:hypothetical protein
LSYFFGRVQAAWLVPPVCGDAEAIVLAMAGSTAALPRLDGDGVAVLSERVNQVSRIRVAQRLTKMGRDYLRSAGARRVQEQRGSSAR